jgi:hypothetical protein
VAPTLSAEPAKEVVRAKVSAQNLQRERRAGCADLGAAAEAVGKGRRPLLYGLIDF